MKVYIAGPMQGKPYYNYPLFDTIASDLPHILGVSVVNPAEEMRFYAKKNKLHFNEKECPTGTEYTYPPGHWKNYAGILMCELTLCDCIYVIEESKTSKGLAAEVALAEYLGIPVFYDLAELAEFVNANR